MVFNDGEFVQDQCIGGVLRWELGEEEVGRWVLEGIWFGPGSAFVGFGGASWLLCQGWAVAELELNVISIQLTGVVGMRGDVMVPGCRRTGLWRDGWPRM